MLPSHEAELIAAATAALALLDEYETLLEQLVRGPDDLGLYRRNAEQFDGIRALTATLPVVRVCWVEVLISRFELLEEVLRRQGKPPQAGRACLADKHAAALKTFRALCTRYVKMPAPADQRR